MNQDLKSRLGGLLLLAVGVGFGWFFILKPLEAARKHLPEVSYELKAILIVPACFIFGLAFLLGGAGFSYRDKARKRITPMGWVLLVVVAVLTGLGFFWMKQQFTALGYTDGV